MLNEIIATALEQLAYAVREYPIQEQVSIKTIIPNNGKKSAEIAIQFSVQKSVKEIRPLEIEIAFWRSKKGAATLILEAFNLETGKGLLREEVNLQHLDDAYPYFEKALDLFSLEKME